jgi:hypothetical protein
MTERSFWTSELQLLTSNWMKIIYLMSLDMKDIVLSRDHSHEEKTEKEGAEVVVPSETS